MRTALLTSIDATILKDFIGVIDNIPVKNLLWNHRYKWRWDNKQQ